MVAAQGCPVFTWRYTEVFTELLGEIKRVVKADGGSDLIYAKCSFQQPFSFVHPHFEQILLRR
ncbi:hypothetical protein D3C74_451660 [compost metagenome]